MKNVKITILGSGTCVPSLKRSSPSVLVRLGNDTILLDVGAGTIRRLLEAGGSIYDVSHVLFSHLHPDHTGEFVPFLFATKYPETYRRRNPFIVAGCRGLSDFYDRLTVVYGQWIQLDRGLLNLVEVDNAKEDHVHFDSFDIKTLPLDHIETSIGFRIIMADGTSIVYTGDTDFCGNAITLADDADILICESAMPDALKVPGHLTPSLAGKIASEAKVKHLVLTHFYPECDTVDVTAQCRKTYDGPLILAQDLMEIEIEGAEVRVKKTGARSQESKS
ncbi:MAG: MBL fold metallo-hydrolase [Deltaproteobacteria bacterium]|nr:MBL fold metallo-hydrolase [Deltaproteobacteria bacterium]